MGEEPSDAGPDNDRSRSDLYRFSGAGVHLAATIGVFAWLGSLLDGKLESRPWFLLAGVFAGFGLGLYNMIRKFLPPPSGTPPKDR